MQYNQLKTTAISFHDSHPGYVWLVMELSMVCAAVYSLFGLFVVATGALITGSTLRMVAGFILAPFYALFLFVVVTVVLTTILTLPYLLFSRHVSGKAGNSRKRTARKSAKPASRVRRTAAAAK